MDKIELNKEDFEKICAECVKQHLDNLKETAEQTAKNDKDKHINPLMFLSEMMTLSLFSRMLIKKIFEGDDNAENV